MTPDMEDKKAIETAENKQKYRILIFLTMFMSGYIAYRPYVLDPHAIGDTLVAMTMVRCVFLLYAMHLFIKLGIDEK